MVYVSNFPNAYKEVYTILQHVNDEDLALIPQKFINLIKVKMNKEHVFEYDASRSFDEQNVLRETKAIFSYIFLNYWANKAQESMIREQFRRDIEQEEEEKKERYNPDDLFKNRQNRTISVLNETANSQTAMTEYKEPILERIKKWFRRIFKRR